MKMGVRKISRACLIECDYEVQPVEPDAMIDKPERRWYQFGFSIRDLLWLTAIVAVVLWALYGKPAAGPPTSGRFMIVRVQLEQSQDKTLLLDTATGQCWWQDNRGIWIDEKTPPSQKK